MSRMNVKIYPSKVSGSVRPPSSKSVLHRAIICASLSKGKSIITNVDMNNDIEATINSFKSLGVNITFENKILEIQSKGKIHLLQNKVIDCNESGSTIRFLIPLMSNEYNSQFKGKAGLLKRPFTIYNDIFKSQGLYFEQNSSHIKTRGKLAPGLYEITGNVSSQFISGLLFTLPLLEGDSTIKIINKFESKQYVDITLDMLNKFGIVIEKIKDGFYIKGNQEYKPTHIEAETDYSQAAFFAVLGIINNDIKIMNLNSNSSQPDMRIISFIENMGGKIIKENEDMTFCKSNSIGQIIDVSQSPDIAPIISLLGAYSKGETNIVNAKRLIIKESNRLLATYEILTKLGVSVEMFEDSLKIMGTQTLKGNTFDSYNDHRIAMTLAIAATVCDSPVTIIQAEAINKSYPNFYNDLENLGVKIEYI